MKRKIALLLAVIMTLSLLPAQLAFADISALINKASSSRGTTLYVERTANKEYLQTWLRVPRPKSLTSPVAGDYGLNQGVDYIQNSATIQLNLLTGVNAGDQFRLTLSAGTFSLHRFQASGNPVNRGWLPGATTAASTVIGTVAVNNATISEGLQAGLDGELIYDLNLLDSRAGAYAHKDQVSTNLGLSGNLNNGTYVRRGSNQVDFFTDVAPRLRERQAQNGGYGTNSPSSPYSFFGTSGTYVLPALPSDLAIIENGIAREQVAYTMAFESDRTAIITVLETKSIPQDGSAAPIIFIPLFVRAGDKEQISVSLSVDGLLNTSNMLQGTRSLGVVIDGIAGGTDVSISPNINNLELFPVNTIKFTETRADSMRSHSAFALQAKDGFEFVAGNNYPNGVPVANYSYQVVTGGASPDPLNDPTDFLRWFVGYVSGMWSSAVLINGTFEVPVFSVDKGDPRNGTPTYVGSGQRWEQMKNPIEKGEWEFQIAKIAALEEHLAKLKKDLADPKLFPPETVLYGGDLPRWINENGYSSKYTNKEQVLMDYEQQVLKILSVEELIKYMKATYPGDWMLTLNPDTDQKASSVLYWTDGKNGYYAWDKSEDPDIDGLYDLIEDWIDTRVLTLDSQANSAIANWLGAILDVYSTNKDYGILTGQAFNGQVNGIGKATENWNIPANLDFTATGAAVVLAQLNREIRNTQLPNNVLGFIHLSSLRALYEGTPAGGGWWVGRNIGTVGAYDNWGSNGSVPTYWFNHHYYTWADKYDGKEARNPYATGDPNTNLLLNRQSGIPGASVLVGYSLTIDTNQWSNSPTNTISNPNYGSLSNWGPAMPSKALTDAIAYQYGYYHLGTNGLGLTYTLNGITQTAPNITQPLYKDILTSYNVYGTESDLALTLNAVLRQALRDWFIENVLSLASSGSTVTNAVNDILKLDPELSDLYVFKGSNIFDNGQGAGNRANGALFRTVKSVNEMTKDSTSNWVTGLDVWNVNRDNVKAAWKKQWPNPAWPATIDSTILITGTLSGTSGTWYPVTYNIKGSVGGGFGGEMLAYVARSTSDSVSTHGYAAAQGGLYTKDNITGPVIDRIWFNVGRNGTPDYTRVNIHYTGLIPSTVVPGVVEFTSIPLLLRATDNAPDGDVLVDLYKVENGGDITEQKNIKVGTRKNWGILFTAGSPTTLYTGQFEGNPRGTSDDWHKTARVTFGENLPNSWLANRQTIFEVPVGVKITKVAFHQDWNGDNNTIRQTSLDDTKLDGIVLYPRYETGIVENGNAKIAAYMELTDNKLILSGLTLNPTDFRRTAEIRMDFWVTIAADYVPYDQDEQDITLTVHGPGVSAEGTDTDTVTIAVAKRPIDIKVSQVTDIKIGYQHQTAADFDIVENKAGILRKNDTLKLSITDKTHVNDISFVDANYLVTEGDLKLSNFVIEPYQASTAASQGLETVGSLGSFATKITLASSKPSTISFTDVQIKVDRTVPQSNASLTESIGYDILAWGNAVANNYDTTVTPQFGSHSSPGISAPYLRIATQASGILSSRVAVTEGETTMYVDGKAIEMDTAAYIDPETDSLMVPVRFVSLALMYSDAAAIGGDADWDNPYGAVQWDESTRTVSIYTPGTDGRVIQFTIGSDQIIVNGIPSTMTAGGVPGATPVTAQIQDERSFIPFRALGNALGVPVGWDEETRTAIFNP